jgi:cbb3-type cytochrome c oxidase subunit III
MDGEGWGCGVSKLRDLSLVSLLSLASVVLLAFCQCARGPTSPGGEALYRRYCASCHGVQGRGDGPLADALKRRPTDLTQLAKQSGGKLDEPKLLSFIDGRRSVKEHGPREMPVWGAVFDEELKNQLYREYTGLLQSRSLVDYIGRIQEK